MKERGLADRFFCRSGFTPGMAGQPVGDKPRPATGRSAFTLLELLVAVTITLVLSGLVLGVVTNTLNLWHRTQDSFTTAAQAKLALDLIERDLQAAIFRKDGATWLAVDVINDPDALTPHGWLMTPGAKPATAGSQRLVPASTAPTVNDTRFGLSGAWLRFVTTNVESDGSLPVAVSYQVARRPITGVIDAGTQADIRYGLFRSAVSATNTFMNGNDVTAAGYGSVSGTPAATRNPATLANPSSTDALATNVVDFGVWLHVRDGAGGLRRIFPADGLDAVHAARDSGAAADPNRFPEIVDVMVRILTEQGAALLAEMESGRGGITRPPEYESDAVWWWAVVETNSRVHTRRVEVKGRAL